MTKLTSHSHSQVQITELTSPDNSFLLRREEKKAAVFSRVQELEQSSGIKILTDILTGGASYTDPAVASILRELRKPAKTLAF